MFIQQCLETFRLGNKTEQIPYAVCDWESGHNQDEPAREPLF